jgi:glutamyl-tRNA reductase
MRVAIGLDSMILGEPQILGQLKDSFNTAATYKVMGQQLHRISQNTYRVAKSVRTETAIGESTVSAASTAVDLANQLFADLKTCRALLVGAGETIEIVARHLQAAGVQQLVIANRTIQNALALANEVGGVATILNDLPNQLLDADIVITSTASDLPIIGKGMAERALKARRHRPIFMVDLAVPRDIEPEVNELRDVYLYSIDDLQQIIADNLSTRAEAATAAEAMIQTAVVEFSREDKSREITDILVKFRQKHESIKQAELAKALKRLEKGEDPVDVLTGLANQLTNKIIHNPSVQMKQAKADGREDILGAINDLFDLEP